MLRCVFFFFFFNDTATTEIYTLSLHDALPIYGSASSTSVGSSTGSARACAGPRCAVPRAAWRSPRRNRCGRSEEHTSELQSQSNLVCRLLLEKKKKEKHDTQYKK